MSCHNKSLHFISQFRVVERSAAADRRCPRRCSTCIVLFGLRQELQQRFGSFRRVVISGIFYNSIDRDIQVSTKQSVFRIQILVPPSKSQKEHDSSKNRNLKRFTHCLDEWIIDFIELAVVNVLVVGPLFDILNGMKFVRKGDLANHIERQGRQVGGQINLSWWPLLVVVNGYAPILDKFRNKRRDTCRQGLFHCDGLKGRLNNLSMTHPLSALQGNQSFSNLVGKKSSVSSKSIIILACVCCKNFLYDILVQNDQITIPHNACIMQHGNIITCLFPPTLKWLRKGFFANG
mmetsp:Transcript_16262/g.21277  ORF Transcript_16262/g.21277 Transcript_16262/m.21277 type:complete len:291 (-) Transcript_16262:282-1154(-)